MATTKSKSESKTKPATKSGAKEVPANTSPESEMGAEDESAGDARQSKDKGTPATKSKR